MKYFNGVILIMLLSLSCQKECPEDVHLEEIIQLMPKSFAAHPYAGKTQAVFVNENNDTIKYAVTGFDTINVYEFHLGQICSRKDTEAALFGKLETTGGRLVLLGTPNTSQVYDFIFSISPRNLNSTDPLDTVFVDALLLFSHLYTETPSIGVSLTNNWLELITCDRGNANSELLQKVEEEYYESITLSDTQFEQVYKSTGPFRDIYYNFEQGILAFEDQTTFWVLNRLE